MNLRGPTVTSLQMKNLNSDYSRVEKLLPPSFPFFARESHDLPEYRAFYKSYSH
jgi:hypothetical protein